MSAAGQAGEWEDVLIDTWWNVNESIPLSACFRLAVLIDTWWNVNVSAAGQAGEWEDSFNRYMVECEYVQK